jgi:serine/threonine protein phosphatase 1
MLRCSKIHFLRIYKLTVKEFDLFAKSKSNGFAMNFLPDIFNHFVYAVGDIHGCPDLLRDMLKLIETDAQKLRQENPNVAFTIVFLGDYVDKGPESNSAIETLIRYNQSSDRVIDYCHFIRGNHDEYFLRILEGNLDQIPDPDHHTFSGWMTHRSGGRLTLESYGINDLSRSETFILNQLRSRVPISHKEFLYQLTDSVRIGDFHFSHAGFNPYNDLDKQRSEDLVWGFRGPRDLPEHGYWQAYSIHGHYGQKSGVPLYTQNRTVIDTAAYRTGILSAIRLNGFADRFQKPKLFTIKKEKEYALT